MVVWLVVYTAGFVFALGAVASIAHTRRTSHQMSRRNVALLTLAAGLLWPLLAVAGLQVAGLVVLKTALGVVHGRGDEAVATVEADTVPALLPLAAAAA